MLTPEQQAILDKLAIMNSLPGVIAWGTEQAVGAMSMNLSGSRSQETQAVRAYGQFLTMGGQAELDRLRLAVNSNAELNAAWRAMIAAGNSGDWFSAIGDTIVSAVPVALAITAAYFLAPIALEAASGTVATAGTATVSTVSTAATGADVIATMSGAGVGFTDAALAAAAASAPGVAGAAVATAEMVGASWATLATGTVSSTAGSLVTLAQNMPTNLPSAPSAPSAPVAQNIDTFSKMQQIQQGVNVGDIFGGISGTVKDLAGTAVDVYGAMQGVKLQQAQIDLATQQAQNAARASANPPMYQTAAGGINWTVIGLGVAALLGVFLMMKKA